MKLKNYREIINELKEKFSTDVFETRVTIGNKIRRFFHLPYILEVYFLNGTLYQADLLIFDKDKDLERAKLISIKEWM